MQNLNNFQYDWHEFFTPDEMQEMRRPEFMDEVEAIVKAISIQVSLLFTFA
jgi:hypothetical protein